MQKKRRTFLQTAGIMTAGSMVLPNWACSGGSKETETTTATTEAAPAAPTPSLDKFGIQLYTLRDVIPADPKGTLKQLADFGYKQIEGYEHKEQGIYWNMSHTDFKKYLDDTGLQMVASHCDINKDFEKKVGEVAEIGVEYMICPWVGPQENMDEWRKIADKFNECGEICKKAGIRFAYHNHAYSFKPVTDIIPHDFLMDNTDPALVDHEMDIYWVVTAGVDPAAYLAKYSNRFRLCHVKDRMKTATPDEREASCDLGTGSIDYPKILKVAADHGMKYFILEQERYDGSTPMDSAKVGADYLKQLVFA
ncbi:MAG: sugar phosphate isomerase/epimerase [Bacteroidota bacterium]